MNEHRPTWKWAVFSKACAIGGLKMYLYKVLTSNGFITSEIPGKFAGWRPGKIYGRLDCKSGMRMLDKNRVFFLTQDDALACGYRACRKCKP